MITTQLGQLEPVKARDVWQSESADFTPWLAQQDNLRLLGETLGLSLQVEQSEAWVGMCRADILCKDINNDSWVIIENQLEKIDHSHLGQILTYAAGLDAVTIIWIAAAFTDEHRAAIDWLNENTVEGINFFALEIEVWKIGNSSPAPKFNIVSKPNEWTRNIATPPGPLTALKALQLEYWSAYKQFVEERGALKCAKPYAQGWLAHPMGISGYILASVISTFSSETKLQTPEIRVELNMMDNAAKENMRALEEQREMLEQVLGTNLCWHNPENTKSSRIYLRRDAPIGDKDDWPNQFLWLLENATRWFNVLPGILRNI